MYSSAGLVTQYNFACFSSKRGFNAVYPRWLGWSLYNSVFLRFASVFERRTERKGTYFDCASLTCAPRPRVALVHTGIVALWPTGAHKSIRGQLVALQSERKWEGNLWA